MRKISVYFEGFWKGFDNENNFIINILRKYFDVIVSNQPEYLFYSIFNDNYLKYDCVKIFFTGENLSPDFNVCDFAMAYDDIQFGDRYLRFPLWLLYDSHFERNMINGVEITSLKRMHNDGKREKFCSFVYSNGNADPFRKALYEKLDTYKHVDSGGRFMNNVGGPVKNKLTFEAEHRFSIACENVSQAGYTTEKLVEAFVSGAVPIYWGDPDVIKDFNPKAFINCMDYDSIEDIIKMIREIDQNQDLYEDMMTQRVFQDEQFIDHKYEAVEQFLVHIVELPYEKARKNARFYWKKIYQKKLIQGTFVYGLVEKLKSVVR